MIIRSITAPNPGPLTLDGTRTYLLADSAVLDPGPAEESHVRAILQAVPRLETILITHRHADHAPAAVALKERTGARVFAPRSVLDDTVVDQRLRGGETIEVGTNPIEVIATPGHTSEHVCFLTSDGDLFTGDTILGSGTSAIFPPDGHMGDYLRSLALLRSKSPRRIHPAHGPTRDDAVALIDEYIAHRLERERQVLAAIGSGASTVPLMRLRIYPDLDPRLHAAAEMQLTAHLIKLIEERRVVEREGASFLISED
ncbi:MAG TPA: MBL fold metallo-hydrolase [Thermoanaerobaculia bacterium]|nr:MBL fold metallo-hydrolase [Thermoanaerobaculia bacterium]